MTDFKKRPTFGKKSFGARPSFGAKRSSAYGRRDSDGPVELFQATCNECHKPCEVPFRPNGKKPVYCRDCFKSQETSAPSYPYKRATAPEREERGSSDLKNELGLLNSKIDRLISAIEAQTRLLSRSK